MAETIAQATLSASSDLNTNSGRCTLSAGWPRVARSSTLGIGSLSRLSSPLLTTIYTMVHFVESGTRRVVIVRLDLYNRALWGCATLPLKVVEET